MQRGGLILNGGFEVNETTGGSLPTTTGDWAGDFSAIVGAQDGITPSEGTQMLNLMASTLTGDPPYGGGSNMWQLIDAAPFFADISAGVARFAARADFNRVLGDVETDTLFELTVRAYAGSPSDFPTQNQNFLTVETATLISDGDISTWETAAISDFSVPTNTEYLALVVRATENVFDDATLPELDGHYVDAVSLTAGGPIAVPEPSGIAIWILLGVGSCWRYQRVQASQQTEPTR